MRNKLSYSLIFVLTVFLFLLAGANDSLPLRHAVLFPSDNINTDTVVESIDPVHIVPPTVIGLSPSNKDDSKFAGPDPDNFNYTSEYDPETGLVVFYQTIGNIPVRLPYTMTLEEYNRNGMRRSMQQYWKSKNLGGGDSLRGSSSSLHLGSEALGSIFGSNVINIRPQGIAEISIGVTTTKIDNPTLQESMRKTTTFDFDQKIQMNIQGTIGEKLKLGINYNTEATFDFENQISLEYTGKEDEIIKKIEAGNVSMPLPGTLITGSQSLFGIKTEMQFGKLTATTVLSQQKGETSVISIQGGAQSQEYEIDIDEYDKNRHFFLSHYFRDKYDKALANLPVINSMFNITKIEVWVTNKTSDYDDSRNIAAFTDLAENSSNMANTTLWGAKANAIPSNSANNLYTQMTSAYSSIRDIDQITTTLSPLSASGFKASRDYEKIENARLLSTSEYTLNSKLGYISLNTALNSDEVLAVAYQYTYNGAVYNVGEFSTSGVEAPNTLIVKLIKGTVLSPKVKTWDLMMKNVYSVGAYQIDSEDFVFNVAYLNDSTGNYINYFPEGPTTDQGGIKGKLFLSIMGLDNLNSQEEKTPDGVFDLISDYTINESQGRVFFPVLEPFGSHMADMLQSSPELKSEYVFQELYDSTLTVASQLAEKNKYKLRGSYSSSTSSEISLNAFNVSRGSVVVTAGGITLTENIDYTVDYTSGIVTIVNQGILESSTPIQISYENQSLYNLQTKTLIGTHLNYQINENFNIGGTIMHLREKPLTQKVSYGEEPIANTIWGLNTSFFSQSNAITNWLDKLPLIQTKTPSSISFDAEFAHLIPGHPNVVGSEGASYMDDFEGTETSIDMKTWTAWSLASTPQGQTDLFPEADYIDDLQYGFNRAKLAWYVVDPLFTRNNSLTPSHLRRNADSQSSHYVREVYEKEIFPDASTVYGEPTTLSVLNLAYYPNERGPYNFDTDIDKDGFLNNPETRWGGIMREIQTNDFEAANVGEIEFWVMDPFIYNDGSAEGGDLYINLGDISEDILRDSKKFFEQGLPGPDDESDVETSNWGYIPENQSLVSAFSNDAETRLMQDVGLNGMNSETEKTFYNNTSYPFISLIESLHNSGALTDVAYNKIMDDPASDDFQYYRGTSLDDNEVGILDRYKDFNSPEGNSCPSEYSGESYSTAATTLPDGEDLNDDNTLSETENYYQYKIPIRPDEMEVGKNYITDVVESTVTLKNGNIETIKWYQFKVPLGSPDATIGDVDFSSIRFMRMFLHNFKDTVIFRFASLDLVRSEWREYGYDLFESTDNVVSNPETAVEISAVNIEENSSREPVNYVLPPGVSREVDPSSTSVTELNEQSLSLKVTDLAQGDARAVYKSCSMDIRQFTNLKMFVHAEEVDGYPLNDSEMKIFVRLGTDYQDNYYEYEIPLVLTPEGSYSNNSTSDRYAVWPEDNEMNIPLELFQEVKLRRNDEQTDYTSEYVWYDEDVPNNRVKVKGSPNLGEVKTLMIGVRAASLGSKSVEVWVNELRLTGFNEKGGWAAKASTTIKLADLGSVSLAGSASTIGFGSIDQSVTERSQEDTYQYDIATNLELGKLLGPKSRLSVPFYYSISEQVSTPEYDPTDPDVKLSVSLKSAKTKSERDSIKHVSQDYTRRKSVSLTNVRLQPKKNESKFYDVSNLSTTYSYNETYSRDINTEYLINKNYRGVLSYNFLNRPKVFEPFKNLKNSNLALIRDFNIYTSPTQVSYRWEISRGYNEEQLRNISDPGYIIPLTVTKSFYWNRYFDLIYNISRSLKVDFHTTTNATIDEPEGAVNKKLYREEYEAWKDSVTKNILNMGRTTNYQHTLNMSYSLPVNKLPGLDWISSSLNYGAEYDWEQGTVTDEEYEWGNTITNSNNIQGNGQLNFTTLYNKSPYLKRFNQTGNKQQQQQQGETVRFTQHNLKMVKGEPFSISHRLGTADVQTRVFNESGQPVQGVQTVVDNNTVTFVPQQDVISARVMVTGTKKPEKASSGLILEYGARLVTSLKNVTVNYSEVNSTALAGYMPESKFLGSQSFNGINAPGIPFLLGWQDRDFAMRAVENNWLTTDSTLNTPYIMNHSGDLTIRATFEPIKDLRVDITANHRKTNNLSEYYLFDENGSFRGAFNTYEAGTFSMTFNVFRTSFKKVGRKGAYSSESFDQFLTNRVDIADRLGESRSGTHYPITGEYADDSYGGLQYSPNGYPSQGLVVEEGADGYGLTSQDVMIPAFLAAYSGKSTSKISLDAMPSFFNISPNWKVTYDGLSKIKMFQKYVKSFSLTHGYQSTYTIGSYASNLEWDEHENGFSFIRDALGNFISKYQITGVTITEQYAPLIQVNIGWINNISTSLSFKKSRILNLSLTNNQLTENYSNEWTLGFGYRFDKMDLIFGSRGKQKKMSSDLNLKVDFSLRDNFSIIRRIEEGLNQMSSGQKISSLEFTADYVLSDRFNMQLYYDRQLSNPYISSSYPITNSSFGVSFRFSLAQ